VNKKNQEPKSCMTIARTGCVEQREQSMQRQRDALASYAAAEGLEVAANMELYDSSAEAAMNGFLDDASTSVLLLESPDRLSRNILTAMLLERHVRVAGKTLLYNSSGGDGLDGHAARLASVCAPTYQEEMRRRMQMRRMQSGSKTAKRNSVGEKGQGK
jgi:DNA invertase Pin-like site-specific DNA recombinase